MNKPLVSLLAGGGAYILTNDVGLAIAGLVVAPAFLSGCCVWFRHLLMMSWMMQLLEALLGATKDVVVFSLAVMDLIIAIACLALVTANICKPKAQIIGTISLALMPLHFVMSATKGTPDWTLYAAALNAGFVLQCIVAGGWMDGVGRSIGRLFRRFNPVHLFRRRA